MTIVLIGTGCVLAILVPLIFPKFASVMIWPILFLYPHNWWYELQFLPLNIGGDDLFCLILFLGVVIRRNVIQRIPIRLGYAFWVITAFTIIAAVANFAGSFEIVASESPGAIKDVLKTVVYWALFYAILHCIDDIRDLKFQLGMFSVSAALGATLVVAQHYTPEMLSAFSQPRPYSALTGFTHDSRAAGSFPNPNTAACVLGCSVLLSMTAVRLSRRILVKAFIYALIVVLLVGILYTRSRSGLIALVISVAAMAVVSRGRVVALLVVIGAIGVAGIFAEASGLFGERLTQAYTFETGTPGQNVMGRIETWRMYLTESSISNYLIGQGAAAGVVKFGMESHNAYISLLTVYGLGGAFWGVFALAGLIRRVKTSLRSEDPVLHALASGCMWTLLFWGIYACTADAISSSYARYLLFYLIVLVDRTYALVLLECGNRSDTLVQHNSAVAAPSADITLQARRS